jgi:hypothetical protein
MVTTNQNNPNTKLWLYKFTTTVAIHKKGPGENSAAIAPLYLIANDSE